MLASFPSSGTPDQQDTLVRSLSLSMYMYIWERARSNFRFLHHLFISVIVLS